MKEKRYSANLTGAWFLFYEIKQTAGLISEGLSEEEIKEKIVRENLFQHRKASSVSRVFPTIYRRADLLGDELRNMLIEEDTVNGKLINLYTIMEEDLLFKEFMLEVISQKYAVNNLFIEKKDINSFFTQKAEQDSKFAGYSETTKNKLRQVYLKILMESGVLKSLKSGELNKILIDPYLAQALKANNAEYFLNIFK